MAGKGGTAFSTHTKLAGSKAVTTLRTLCGKEPGANGWINQTGKPAVKKSWTMDGLKVIALTDFVTEVAASSLPFIRGRYTSR